MPAGIACGDTCAATFDLAGLKENAGDDDGLVRERRGALRLGGDGRQHIGVGGAFHQGRRLAFEGGVDADLVRPVGAFLAKHLGPGAGPAP